MVYFTQVADFLTNYEGGGLYNALYKVNECPNLEEVNSFFRNQMLMRFLFTAKFSGKKIKEKIDTIFPSYRF